MHPQNLCWLIFKEFYPAFIIFLLWLFGYLKLIYIILGLLTYCFLNQVFANTKLFYNKSNPIISKILEMCPSITKLNYKPPFYMPFSFLQFPFVLTSKVQPNYKINVNRENIGGNGICVDWVTYEGFTPKEKRKNEILLVIPGLTGTIEDPYVMNTVDKSINSGYITGIYQMRILNKDVKLPQEEGVNVSLFEDLDFALKYLKKKFGKDSKFFTIGYSYGANQMVRYLGDYNKKTKIIEAAVSISNPYDFSILSVFLEYTIYGRLMLKFEQDAFKVAKSSIQKDKKYNIDCDAIEKTIAVRDYDKYLNSKIYGYNTADEYYRCISCAGSIKNVDVPLLCIHAKDDRVVHYFSIPMDDIENNPNVALLLTNNGNHSCFLESKGLFKVQMWVVKPAIDFINAANSVRNKKN